MGLGKPRHLMESSTDSRIGWRYSLKACLMPRTFIYPRTASFRFVRALSGSSPWVIISNSGQYTVYPPLCGSGINSAVICKRCITLPPFYNRFTTGIDVCQGYLTRGARWGRISKAMKNSVCPYFISGRVLYDGDGQNKGSLRQQTRLLMQQLPLPYLFTSSCWLNKETANNKYYTNNTQRDSQEYRKSFKKITCKSNGKNSNTQVEYCLGNKFSATSTTVFHYYNFYHILRELSSDFARGMRWLG